MIQSKGSNNKYELSEWTDCQIMRENKMTRNDHQLKKTCSLVLSERTATIYAYILVYSERKPTISTNILLFLYINMPKCTSGNSDTYKGYTYIQIYS